MYQDVSPDRIFRDSYIELYDSFEDMLENCPRQDLALRFIEEFGKG